MEMTSSEGAAVEEVTGDVPPSNGRKGKRQLLSDTDLQPTPKKIYNLRNRKSKLSEEEVATNTPTSNLRTGKRLAESDSGFQVTSKKPYYSRRKTSTLSEEEEIQKGTESIDGELQNVEETLEMSTKASAVNDEGQLVSKEEKQSIDEEIEDIKENLEVTTNITVEETKEELGIKKGTESIDGELQNVDETLEMSAQACAVNDEGKMVSIKEKQSVTEEIEDMKGYLEVNANITVEETKEELGIQKGTESMCGEFQNVEETLQMSAQSCAVNDQGQLDSKEEKQSVTEEFEDMKENLEVNANITAEDTKEALALHKDYGVGKNIGNVSKTFEMSTSEPVENAMGELGSAEEKESINKETKDIREAIEVKLNTTIAVEEVKGELCFKEVKENISEEIRNMKEPAAEVKTKIIAEEVNEYLDSREEKESTNLEVENVKETLKMSTMESVGKAERELGPQNEKESTHGEIETLKETLEMSTRESVKKSEGEMGSQHEKESVHEEIEALEETLEISTRDFVKEYEGELGLQMEKESVDEEVEDAKETLETSAKASIDNVEGESGPAKEQVNMDGEVGTLEENLEKRTEASVEKTERKMGSQEEKKGIDEEIEDMNVPSDEVKVELASYEGGSTDEEMKGAVESWEPSRSGCTTDSQEKTEDEVISAKVTPEASKKVFVEEAKEEQSSSPAVPDNDNCAGLCNSFLQSFTPVPKTSVATRSKILFMGNLPYSIGRRNVLNFFEDVGNVIDIRMAKNADGSMKGFCHVTFATEAAAVKALEKNGEMLYNRNVKLDFAENLSNKHVLDSTVLVRGLERSQQEEDIRKSLMKHFEDCGTIKDIHVPKDIQAGDSRRVAFIKFEDSEAVSKAVKLCGSELGASKLFVKEVGRSRYRRKFSNDIEKKSRRKATKQNTQ